MKDLTPKVNIFYWLAIQNRILMVENLRKCGMKLPNRCSLCRKEEENVNHLLLYFPFSQKCLVLSRNCSKFNGSCIRILRILYTMEEPLQFLHLGVSLENFPPTSLLGFMEI